MFVLVEVEDVVQVAPAQLGDAEGAVLAALARKYVRRVLPGAGLCVAVHDLLSVTAGAVPHAEGAAFHRVRFRVAAFRPAPGEVLAGRVCACSAAEGVQVSLGFTSAVVVPPAGLPRPAQFDDAEGQWLWDYQGNSLYFEPGEPVRVRVAEVRFRSPARPPPLAAEDAAAASQQPQRVPLAEQPMLVVAEALEPGFGMLKWWHDSDDG